MRYFIDIDGVKTELLKDNTFKNFGTRHAVRSVLVDEDGFEHNKDYYNLIYAEPDLIKFDTDLVNHIQRFIYSFIIGFFIGLVGLIWFNEIITMLIMISIGTISYIGLNIKYIIDINKLITSHTDVFNNRLIEDTPENWIQKNKNNKYSLIFDPGGDYDFEDFKHIEIDDEDYKFLSKYWYEIDNFISFPGDDYLYETIYNKSTEILIKDIPKDAKIIR